MDEKSKKATNVEVNQRVSVVETLLLEGRTKGYIVRYSADNWNLAERQTEEYINRAWERIKEVSKLSLQDNLGLVLSNYWDLYRAARNDGDLKTANSILNNISKVTGLEQSTINHIVTDARELETMDNDELNRQLEAAMNGIQ